MISSQIRLPVHETFQNTIQGEGYWAGTPVDFIRLAGCPVACPWCDTGYSDGGKHTPRSLRSLDELLQELRSPRVVITGGEPFIHQDLPRLVDALLFAGKQISIETSGAFWQPLPDDVWITLSPKQHVSHRYPVQEPFWQRANEIKFVISTGKELEFYQPYLTGNRINVNLHCPIYLQPEWSQREQSIPIILNLLQHHPTYKLSLQTHKYIGVL